MKIELTKKERTLLHNLLLDERINYVKLQRNLQESSEKVGIKYDFEEGDKTYMRFLNQLFHKITNTI